MLSQHRAAAAVHARSWPPNRCSARRSSTTATGDAHYDAASALIKSIRGSDPDAAIYWLARMLEAGEDVRFLARRLVILASEDIGNADPQALPLAVAAMQACEFVGLPECQLTLAQAVAYLACAPKSNAATVAIGEARRDVREGRLLPVPRASARPPLPRRQAAGPRRGLSIRPQQPRRRRRAGLFGSRAGILSAGRSRASNSELAERLAKIRAMLRWRAGKAERRKRETGEIADRRANSARRIGKIGHWCCPAPATASGPSSAG